MILNFICGTMPTLGVGSVRELVCIIAHLNLAFTNLGQDTSLQSVIDVLVLEEVVLRVVEELVAVEAGCRPEQPRHRVAVSVDAEHETVLILHRLVVAIIFASQVEGDASVLEDALVTRAICSRR